MGLITDVELKEIGMSTKRLMTLVAAGFAALAVTGGSALAQDSKPAQPATPGVPGPVQEGVRILPAIFGR